jgi:hypothetical protein
VHNQDGLPGSLHGDSDRCTANPRAAYALGVLYCVDQTMRIYIAAMLCTTFAFAAGSIAVAQQKTAGSSNAGEDRPIHSSIKEIMELIIDPSATEIWQAVKTVTDREGIHELSPKTAEEWLDMRRAAVQIMEGGNLLMMPDREAAPVGTKSKTPGVELEPAEINTLIKKDRQSFDAFARALRNLGLEALRASDDKNASLLLEIADQMQPVCAGCHHTFWYPLQPH